MDERTFIICIQLQRVFIVVYKMNKDNLTINNDKMRVCAIRTKQQLAEVCI